MKKSILGALIAFSIYLPVAGADETSVFPMGIIVPANATLTINRKSDLPRAVDIFVLHDGATLSINPDIGSIEFTARKAYFGSNSRIVSNGKSANRPGAHGSIGPGGAECKVGGSGTAGGSGNVAQKGLDMKLNLGIVAFGSLSIHANGGNSTGGGNGGNGGTGGIARVGSSNLCSGGNGGTGGSGGIGGAAVRGGNITIEWWDASQDLALDLISPVLSSGGLQVSVNAGKLGSGGNAGPGGAGGGSKCRKIAFAKICKGSGNGGSPGGKGANGPTASDGQVVITRKHS